MPRDVEYTEDGGVVIRYSGHLTGQEIIEAVREVLLAPDARRVRYYVADRTNISEFEATPEQVRTLAALNESILEAHPGIRGVLVSPGDLEFGMSRMYQGFSGRNPFPLFVCRSLDEAREWLAGGADDSGSG